MRCDSHILRTPQFGTPEEREEEIAAIKRFGFVQNVLLDILVNCGGQRMIRVSLLERSLRGNGGGFRLLALHIDHHHTHSMLHTIWLSICFHIHFDSILGWPEALFIDPAHNYSIYIYSHSEIQSAWWNGRLDVRLSFLGKWTKWMVRIHYAKKVLPAMRRRASILRYTYLLCWPRIQFNRSSLFSGTPWGYVCVGIASNERQYGCGERSRLGVLCFIMCEFSYM